MLQPKFGYKYLGPYSGPLEKQMIYDKKVIFTNVMINPKIYWIK